MAATNAKNSCYDKSELLLAALFALLALGTVIYVRLQLLGIPFERDEGEFAYSGQLVLRGLPPYLHAYTMKLPGMAYLTALFMSIFGENIRGVHLGLLISSALSLLFIFLIARRLFGIVPAAVSAGVLGLLTLSQHLLGTFAHATHFAALFVLAASLLIVTADGSLPRSRYFLTGLFLGCAFLIKQHAVLFVLSSLLYIMYAPKSSRNRLASGLPLLAGFVIPYLLVVAVMVKQGVFGKFWLWTVSYSLAYASGLTVAAGWLNLKSQLGEILASTGGYWALAAAGLLLLMVRRSREGLLFALPLLLCSFLAICPGFYFRPHYFILLAPAIALLAGAVLTRGFLPPAATKPLLVAIIAAAAFQVWQEGWYLLPLSPPQYLQKIYQTAKPFAESVVIADYVKGITKKSEPILVIGSEPQIYFYAGRLSATGHIYMYPLMEEQPFALSMQAEMLQQIERSNPACVVLVDDANSWLAVSREGELFRQKLGDFVVGKYALDGVVSVSRDNQVFYVFGERAGQFMPASASKILIYRRK